MLSAEMFGQREGSPTLATPSRNSPRLKPTAATLASAALGPTVNSTLFLSE